MSSGDALLLYTDGLSEAGPNRRELLGTSGLMRLLMALPEDVDVQVQAELLVDEVSRYASRVSDQAWHEPIIFRWVKKEKLSDEAIRLGIISQMTAKRIWIEAA